MNIKMEIFNQVKEERAREQIRREKSMKESEENKIKLFRKAMLQVFRIELPKNSRRTQLQIAGVTLKAVYHYSTPVFRTYKTCPKCRRKLISENIHSAREIPLVLKIEEGKEWTLRHDCIVRKKTIDSSPPTREQQISRILHELLSYFIPGEI